MYGTIARESPNILLQIFFASGKLAKIKNDVIKLLLNLNLVVTSEKNIETKKENIERNDEEFKKVGRNEKCPCGSGKKYKHCHGKVA